MAKSDGTFLLCDNLHLFAVMPSYALLGFFMPTSCLALHPPPPHAEPAIGYIIIRQGMCMSDFSGCVSPEMVDQFLSIWNSLQLAMGIYSSRLIPPTRGTVYYREHAMVCFGSWRATFTVLNNYSVRSVMKTFFLTK